MPPTPHETDPWFATLEPARREALLARARGVNLQVGARVYGIGEAPDGLWSVSEGEVRLISYPAVGVESVTLIIGPGSWFGELSVVDGGPRPHDAIVSKPARLLHIPLSAIDQIAQQHPLLFRDLARLVCSRQRGALSFMGHSIAQPISARLSQTLAGAARGSGGATVQIRQEDLAAMIGVSRQTINKELRRLEQAGAISVGYGSISIRDWGRLRAP